MRMRTKCSLYAAKTKLENDSGKPFSEVGRDA